MPLTDRRNGPKPANVGALLVGLGLLLSEPAQADACAPPSGLAPCFDANSLWLPAGPAAFMTLPDTRVNDPGKINLGFTSELLRGPVRAHVTSPDSGGRDVRVVDYALDASLFFTIGAFKDFQLSLTLPTRVYQNGAGADGVASQSAPPIAQQALRDPRLGVAYSLDDVLARPGVGLRLAADVSVPLGNQAVFAGERSLVLQPSVTFGWQLTPFALRASFGARVREAVEFGDVRLGNQGLFAFGAGIDALAPGLLFFSLEALALPPLASNRASTANSALSGVTLFPAEWLFAVHSSLRPSSQWSLSIAAGTGLPLSSETRHSSTGSSTVYFLAVTEPEWRALIAVRFAPR